MKNKTSYLLELHYKRPLYRKMYTITNSNDADICLRENISLKRINHKEFFWVILMTQASGVLGISEISSGKTDATTINYKEIVQLVSLANASAVILAHNHPSGNLDASKNDVIVTKRVQEVLRLVDVRLYDHLIISTEGHYSMVDDDLISRFT